jgi:hypothetical protein
MLTRLAASLRRLLPSRYDAILRFIALSALIFVFFGAETTINNSGQNNYRQEGPQDNQKETSWRDPVVLLTIFIALFNGGLVYFTYRLVDSTKKLWNVAIDEFNATHRPRLVVRDVIGTDSKIFYLLINIGDAPATIVESWITVERITDKDAVRPLLSTGHNDLGAVSLGVGEVKDMSYETPDWVVAGVVPIKGSTELYWLPGAEIHFAGTIVYEDTAGQRRRTVFRRRWDGKAFRRLDDPDQEYAD